MKKKNANAKTAPEIKIGSVPPIDLKNFLTKAYGPANEGQAIDISCVKYSNLAYIQATGRDVYVDFLEMPGVIKDNKQVINGTRIYMSHVAAEKLAEALSKLLNQLNEQGVIETMGKS